MKSHSKLCLMPAVAEPGLSCLQNKVPDFVMTEELLTENKRTQRKNVVRKREHALRKIFSVVL